MMIFQNLIFQKIPALKLLTKYIDGIEKKQILFNNYSNKIIKLMNYDDISKFNFSKNSSSKIVNIINSYNY